ncbi:hypothetical protein SAMN04487866_11832 [Thermoactinomyces sp. DSM 45891]|nr:hypothetical protein SAMN04487866_11832 [Thermoactinomyces sp. DSM 45891]
MGEMVISMSLLSSYKMLVYLSVDGFVYQHFLLNRAIFLPTQPFGIVIF